MKNHALGRKVLDHIEAHPEQVDMTLYGKQFTCGTVACLAGHTLLQSGYQLRNSTFFLPDGSGSVTWESQEARELLGLTQEEMSGGGDYMCSLFDAGQTPERAIARFRAIVEKAEAAAAGEER